VEHNEVPAKNIFYKKVSSVVQTVLDISPFEVFKG